MSSFLRTRAFPRAARTFSTTTKRTNFAKMTIVGRLGDTPELQATSTGQDVLRYVVATSTGPRDNQKTSWWRVASFLPEGPQRDFIAGLEKGTLVLIEGEPSMNSYNDPETGKTKSSLSIIQRDLKVLSAKKPSEST